MAETPEKKVTIATVWLDGCSGCHMSFLDMDERLLALAPHIQVVYSPIVDSKSLPESVDLGLIEGAISNEDDLAKAKKMRKACKFLIELGDCAVTGNVPSMRNALELPVVYDRAYADPTTVDLQPQRPEQGVPALLERAEPIHRYMKVDLHLPGCPPPADAIHYVLAELLAGRTPDPSSVSRFGA